MVKYNLEVSMQLENVTKVEAAVDKRWHLKVTCSNCQETSPKWHGISILETSQRGRAEVNFLFVCPMCKRTSTISIVEGSNKPYIYDEKASFFQPMVSFEARGLELCGFDPSGEWTVTGPKKTFSDVTIDGEDWADYDDQENCPVSILSFSHQFTKV